MPSRPANETPDEREHRLGIQRAYQARRIAKDPVGTRKRACELNAAYRKRHPERVRAKSKRWRANNRAKVNETRRAWRSKNLVRCLLNEARSRARARGVEFTITLGDIPPMGTRCPLLGHPFPPPDQRRTPFSPSLDRIDPTKGYVPGNVWIVGYRANLIKNDGTAEEHEDIARAMRAATK